MTEQLRRVGDEENRKVDGLGVCSEAVFAKCIADATEVRQRQAKYLASLPSAVEDRLTAARREISGDLYEMPDTMVEAGTLAIALRMMLNDSELGWRYRDMEGARWIGDRIDVCLREVEGKILKAIDILQEPARRA